MGDATLETRVFVFADLESSTRLWETFPEAMKVAMERHDAILRTSMERCGGRVVKTTGDGLMAVFSSAADGVAACLEAQLRLQDETWGEAGPLRVRMGIHAGVAQPRAGDFYGPPVNRAARIMAAAHGGQVLLSTLAAGLVEGHLPPSTGLRDLGEHRLKDLFQSEHLFQLVHPKLPSEFPPLATLSRGMNNLPTQMSEFLGRESLLHSIRRLLDASSVRLLTLTGPGGIGKTRLALQAAADQIDRFPDGVYFVDLSPARDPHAAFEAIARTVNLTGTSGQPPLDMLRQGLQARRSLLLLDNFEQVMEAAGGIAELLQHCPGIEILVTSREALRVRGEHLVPVPPLSLPDANGQLSAETVAGYEAVRLFVERAREARPGFALTDHNAAAVAEICARLDGLPLAIELAAARLTLFSPDELRDRLGTRLDLLRGGPRDLPARQRTLRATIEWSYDLLDPEERTILRLLSVFSPTRVDIVESVAARLESSRDIDVIDRLASLVDKSLVRSVEVAGGNRLSMLETIREYATARLEEEPSLALAARQAHAGYFSEFVESRREHLYGRERERTLDELASEIGNLTTAWRYWVGAGDLERLNRLLDGLWALHDARGWYHATVELTNDLLNVLSAVPATRDRAREEITLRTSLARGLLAIQGYTSEVEENFTRALTLSEETGALPQRVPVLRSIAAFRLYRGEFDKTAALGRELLDLAQQQGDVGLQVEGHLVLGSSLAFGGEIRTGLDQLDRAIALFDPQRGASRFRFGPNPGAASYTTSALLLWLTGYPDRAVERAVTALELARRLNHPFTLAFTLFHVGFLDLWRHELSSALERARAAREVAEDHDYQVWKAVALILEGAAMTGLGQPEEGLIRSERGTALYQGLKTPPIFWPLVLYLRAGSLAQCGQPADAIELIDQAIEMNGERFLFPEFALLKGDLLLAVTGPAESEPWFRSGLDVAGKLGFRMAQLRAASRLTRLARASGKDSDGSAELRQIYQTFTEGFDTADLVEAGVLLADGTTRAV